MPKELFRKEAIQKLYSPEQLDQLIHITKPHNWMILVAIFAVLGAFVLWSIFGSLPIKVEAHGILLAPDGLNTVKATTTGKIIGISSFKPGDHIAKDQVIARVDQVAVINKIKMATAYLNLLLQEKSTIAKHLNNNSDLQVVNSQIQETELALKKLQLELDLNSAIVSPYVGHVLSLMVAENDEVNDQTPIMMLESDEQKLHAMLYLSPLVDVDDIKPGMAVEVFPTATPGGEDGFVIGRVYDVSNFPATPASMLATLRNPDLVPLFSQAGPPYVVDVELLSDPKTASGYLWSSVAGKSVNIASGMLCSAFIITKKDTPFNLIKPESN